MRETSFPGLLRLLRVPSRPQAPDGSPGTLRVVRAAPGFFHYRLLVWGGRQALALMLLVLLHVVLSQHPGRLEPPAIAWLARTAERLAWLAYLVQLPLTLALVRLDFELRWYLVSERALRVREGILRLREKTMTYANVQQVSIRQGPLQRLLGIADVRVQTAGGGSRVPRQESAGVAEGTHEAYLRGVADAGGIRDTIRERVRRFRDAGLGDPDEPAQGTTPLRAEAPDPLEAGRELLEEVRRLRSALTGPGGG